MWKSECAKLLWGPRKAELTEPAASRIRIAIPEDSAREAPGSAGGLLQFDGSGKHLSHRNEGGPVSPHPGPLPEEREKDVPRWGESVRVGFAKSRSRIPPLLGGEGWGEGEAYDPTIECVPMVASAGGWPEGPNGFEPFIVSSFWLCRRSLTHLSVRSERLGLGARGDQKRLPPTGPVLRLLRAALCRTPLFFPVVTE